MDEGIRDRGGLATRGIIDYRVLLGGGNVLRQIRKRKGRFVVFLHADLRSDGLIAAACCNWVTGRCFGMQDGVVVTQEDQEWSWGGRKEGPGFRIPGRSLADFLFTSQGALQAGSAGTVDGGREGGGGTNGGVWRR